MRTALAALLAGAGLVGAASLSADAVTGARTPDAFFRVADLGERTIAGPKSKVLTLRPNGRSRGWVFAPSGRLRYDGRDFSPPVRLLLPDTQRVHVWLTSGSDWAAVGVVDVDGKNQTFVVNTSTMASVSEADASKGYYWSPDLRFIVSANGYEGDYFSIFDTKSGRYKRGELLTNGENTILIEGEPRWSPSGRYFHIGVVETTDPWAPDRQGEDVKLLQSYYLKVRVPSLVYSKEK